MEFEHGVPIFDSVEEKDAFWSKWREMVPEGCECRFEYFRPDGGDDSWVNAFKEGSVSHAWAKDVLGKRRLHWCPPSHNREWDGFFGPSQYGGRTTCMIWRIADNQPVAYGVSVCSWLDNWSYAEGRKWAASHALTALWRNFPQLVPTAVDGVEQSWFENEMVTTTPWALGVID